MDNECEKLCPNCQYRTVEFVISFGGLGRVTAGDICGLDLPGYPEKSDCIGYESKSRNRVSIPNAAHYSVGVASTETSSLNG